MSAPSCFPSPAPALSEAALAARLAAAEARIAALERELRATTARAERREHQLTALLDSLPVGMVLVAPSGQIEAVNPTFRRLFGLAPDQTLAHTYAPYPPDTVSIGHQFRDPAAFAARARALHQAGRTALGEVFRLADGRWVELDNLVLDALHAGRLISRRNRSWPWASSTTCAPPDRCQTRITPPFSWST